MRALVLQLLGQDLFGQRGIRMLKQNWVTYYWTRNNEVLYIGVTNRIVRRFQEHNVIGKRDKIQPNDVFVFELFLSEEDAKDQEFCQIFRHEPKYNTQWTNKELVKPNHSSLDIVNFLVNSK